jgi:hypothetical protein
MLNRDVGVDIVLIPCDDFIISKNYKRNRDDLIVDLEKLIISSKFFVL